MAALALLTVLAAQAAATPVETPTGSKEPSQLGVQTYVDLEGSAGYSTNPNLQFGDNTGAGFGRISVHGVHTLVSQRTITAISAFGQSSFYSRDYGAQLSANLSASHSAQVNEKLNVFGNVNFTYDEGGQLETRIITPPDVPLPPGTTPPPLITPGGDFVSVTGKSYGAGGHIGGQYALSSREFLNASTGIFYLRSKSGGFETHYTTIPLSIGYERQLNSRTGVGANVSAQFNDYAGPANSRTVTPGLTLHTQLSERLIFSGGVGVSFSEFDDGIRTRHSTGLAANANLCSSGERSQLCAYASLSQDAATVAGPARTVTAGLDYSLHLDAKQTIQFSASASRYSSPTALVVGPTFSKATYARAAADYTRSIGNRLFGGASLSARKEALSGLADPKTDVSASLFVRYRLGDVK